MTAYFVQKLDMFKKDSYLLSESGDIKRQFLFTVPYPTSRVRLDELEGADTPAFRVEFLGAPSRLLADPFRQGFQTKSKK